MGVETHQGRSWGSECIIGVRNTPWGEKCVKVRFYIYGWCCGHASRTDTPLQTHYVINHKGKIPYIGAYLMVVVDYPQASEARVLDRSRYNGLRKYIGSRKIMHDAMTSIRSIRCMAKHKEKHIQHNAIIEFPMKLGHTWPILTLAHKTVKWSNQHGSQT